MTIILYIYICLNCFQSDLGFGLLSQRVKPKLLNSCDNMVDESTFRLSFISIC